MSFRYIERYPTGGHIVVSGFLSERTVKKAARERIRSIRKFYKKNSSDKGKTLDLSDRIKIERPDCSSYPFVPRPTLGSRINELFHK